MQRQLAILCHQPLEGCSSHSLVHEVMPSLLGQVLLGVLKVMDCFAGLLCFVRYPCFDVLGPVAGRVECC